MKVCNSCVLIYINILYINIIGIFIKLVIKNLLLEYRNKKIYRLFFYKYVLK